LPLLLRSPPWSPGWCLPARLSRDGCQESTLSRQSARRCVALHIPNEHRHAGNGCYAALDQALGHGSISSCQRACSRVSALCYQYQDLGPTVDRSTTHPLGGITSSSCRFGPTHEVRQLASRTTLLHISARNARPESSCQSIFLDSVPSKVRATNLLRSECTGTSGTLWTAVYAII